VAGVASVAGLAVEPVLVRSDSAAASTRLAWHLREREVAFSLGMPIDAHVRQAILAQPESAWTPAVDPDGQPRNGAEVCELTGWIEQPDGNLHPNVGALVADWDPDSPGPDVFCSGTLIAPTVFLTAAHCIASLEARGITEVWVTFAAECDEDAASPGGLFAGTPVAHPAFGSGGASDTHDIAVVLLARAPAGITPAQLPTAGLLDQLKASHELDDQTFTAVGYGTVREDKTGGPHSLFFDGVRRYALQHALNLEKAWLLLSMNPSTGNGGTRYGDSGGPTSWAG
jgi:hypothetical protein